MAKRLACSLHAGISNAVIILPRLAIIILHFNNVFKADPTQGSEGGFCFPFLLTQTPVQYLIEVVLSSKQPACTDSGKLVGNGRHRSTHQSKIQSKYRSTVQSMSPVQSPESSFYTYPALGDLGVLNLNINKDP